MAQTSGALISDQLHNNGRSGFFFLPPLVPRPGQYGEEVLGLWPTINIDQIQADGSFSQPIATFTRTSGPSGERIRRHIKNGPAVDDDGDNDPNGYFVARWKTANLEAPPGSFFRIRVLADGHNLGFAEVQVVASKKELINVDRNEFVPLLEDRTLRIKFRIERAAVDRDSDGSFDWIDNCPTLPNADQVDAVGNGIGDACRCATSPDACPESPRLFALMTSSSDPPATPASIEIVNLTSMAHVHSIPLGDRMPFSLAVSPDGRKAYVSDYYNGEVVSYDTVSATHLATVSVGFPIDMALSPDGSVLFVGAMDDLVVAIDTATHTIISQYSLSANPLGLSLSPDGSRLGVATTNGANGQALFLFDTSQGLVAPQIVPIVDNLGTCGPYPQDIAFAGGRALLWDHNCDALYQVDLATGSQLQAATIYTGSDNAASMNFNNSLVYSLAVGRAFVLNESRQMLSIDPIGGTVSRSALELFPYVSTASPDGLSVFVSVFDGGGDSLNRIDTITGTTTPSVYQFSNASKGVRDMRIIAP